MSSHGFSRAFLFSAAFVVTSLHPATEVTAPVISGLNGADLLESFDEIAREDAQPFEDLANADIQPQDPGLQDLIHSTVMVFGASADGIGMGTAFPIQKSGRTAIFVTAYQVIERFCDLPEALASDQVDPATSTYPCRALFVLHDAAINTQTKTAEAHGNELWKSEVPAVFYFDKILDLAAFSVELPEKNSLVPARLETSYSVRNPSLPPGRAQVQKPKGKIAVPERPLGDFDLYMIAFPDARDRKNYERRELITKRITSGRYLRTKTFESEKKLGFVSAFKHTLDALQGTSGAPLALSDGRVVAVNATLVISRYLSQGGCSRAELSDRENYAIPAFYLKPLVSALKGAAQ